MSDKIAGPDLARWVAAYIAGQVAGSPDNSLKDGSADKAFDAPLVGFSAGDDPLYDEFCRHIGDFYWRPAQAFALAYPDDPAPAGELSVISWILPQTRATKDENAGQGVYCSRRWAAVRLFGERFNAGLRRDLAQALRDRGWPAIAPMLLPQWKMEMSPAYGYASTWSERHAAHAGGLGTFGLCDGLITPLGKAMRAGSVIVRARLEPTPRPYQDHHAYCLHFSQGTCGKCVPRCPVGALSAQGHDKEKCRRHVYVNGGEHNRKQYNLDIEGCGLCQVGVPCASGIPTAQEGL